MTCILGASRASQLDSFPVDDMLYRRKYEEDTYEHAKRNMYVRRVTLSSQITFVLWVRLETSSPSLHAIRIRASESEGICVVCIATLVLSLPFISFPLCSDASCVMFTQWS